MTQEYLPTEATAVARETMFAKSPLDFPYGVYIAGTTCNDSANVNWAAAVFNSQNMTFQGDVWINGTLAWDYNNTGADMKGHNWKIDGKVMIHGDNSVGTWDTWGAALNAGDERFDLGPFLVKPIVADEQPLVVSRDVLSST